MILSLLFSVIVGISMLFKSIFWAKHNDLHNIKDNKNNDIEYYPDMSNRPEALAYLLGKRDDFND